EIGLRGDRKPRSMKPGKSGDTQEAPGAEVEPSGPADRTSTFRGLIPGSHTARVPAREGTDPAGHTATFLGNAPAMAGAHETALAPDVSPAAFDPAQHSTTRPKSLLGSAGFGAQPA